MTLCNQVDRLEKLFAIFCNTVFIRPGFRSGQGDPVKFHFRNTGD